MDVYFLIGASIVGTLILLGYSLLAWLHHLLNVYCFPRPTLLHRFFRRCCSLSLRDLDDGVRALYRGWIDRK